MEQQVIKFKQQRELGDIITVTFKFVRENYSHIIKNLLKNSAPFFVLLTAGLAYYTYSVSGNPMDVIMGGSGNFIIPFLVFGFTLLLFYSSFYGTILHYINSYINNGGEVDDSEVATGVQKDFFKIFGLSIVSTILVIAGLFLLIIPGIYLSVPISLAIAVLVFKRMSIMESLSYSFNLVKDHWWMTFLTLLVIWLLIYVIGLVFQLPMIIYMFIKAFTMAQEGSLADMEYTSDWVFITLNVFSSIIQYLLSSITIIAVAFIYFNLNEHKNLTGAYETIENLGN